MNRRAFFGAFAAVLAAPVAAMTTKFATFPPMLNISSAWPSECWQTPNRETITAIQEYFGSLLVFTHSAVYELRPA